MNEEMKVYKVEYKGFAYVYADNEEQAKLLFDSDTYAYSEQEVTDVEAIPDGEDVFIALED